ncbi:hypothetical protein B0H16DRAFT_1501908 [Mycena metata]|uniref:F-box domain-containing protein n=1 Tax=Mycena metata TaxID=1033252 RepID=A0AAD7K8E0_9AGAR|nr:hypothetical protein B0H16DRAFT_1501908 [Mycena metata]
MNPAFLDLLETNTPPTAQQATEIRNLLAGQESYLYLDTAPTSDDDLEYFILLRSELFQRLNAALSHMRTFPPEILGLIFIFCRDVDYEYADYPFVVVRNSPMVLTHVCSRWRTVADSTPRLWSTLRFPKSAFKDDGGPPVLQQMLDRSRNLPLGITVQSMPTEQCDSCGFRHILDSDFGETRWLDIVWALHRRLESIDLDLTSEEPARYYCPQQTVFPILSSLNLSLPGNDEAPLVEILESFRNAPALRSLKLHTDNSWDYCLLANFPWSQLTTINLALPVSVEGVRDLLIRCPALEVVILPSLWDLDDLSDDPPPPPLPMVTTLPNLRRLEAAIRGIGIFFVLDALSLPALDSFSLSTPENPTVGFLALQARSQFPLAHFSLSSIKDLTPEQLFSMLRPLAPTLRTLDVKDCACVTNRLFTLLKDPEPQVRLPHLTRLSIYPIALLNGEIIADAVEFIWTSSQHPSEDAAFPKLRAVCLSARRWSRPVFGEDVERRLAALRAAGFLVDDDRW